MQSLLSIASWIESLCIAAIFLKATSSSSSVVVAVGCCCCCGGGGGCGGVVVVAAADVVVFDVMLTGTSKMFYFD